MDWTVAVEKKHVCWQYKPRVNKALLFYHSAHFEPVKRGIVQLRASEALIKSCPHDMQSAFDGQVSRIQTAGFPFHLHMVVLLTEGVLRNPKTCQPAHLSQMKRVAVVPYIHGLSHGLKILPIV